MKVAETTDNKNRASRQLLHYLGGEYRANKIPSPSGWMGGKTYESPHKAQDFCCVLSIPSHNPSAGSFSNLFRSRFPTLRQVVSILLIKIVTADEISHLHSVGLVHWKPRIGENRWLRKIYKENKKMKELQ